MSSSSRSTTTPFCIRRRCSRADANAAHHLRFVPHAGAGPLQNQQQAKLFEEFSRADTTTARLFGGTALWLERNGENAFRISVAVAGFTDADLSIEAKENTLTIRGEKNEEEKTGDVLYKGIAERTFERSFQLADHVVVKGARLENGLLHVDLVREIPEAMKPRAIPIAGSGKVLEVQPTKAAA